jgi:zinc protease
MKRMFSARSIVMSVVLATTGALVTAHAGVAAHVSRSKVAAIDLMTYPMGVEDVVSIVGALPAGDYFAGRNAGNPTIATLTAMMLDKGTTREDKFALAKELDDVGAQLSFTADTQMLTIKGKALKKDVPRLIRILAEELREPAFTPEEFEKAKKQLAGELRQHLDTVNTRAREAFLMAVFPEGHPNRPVAFKEWIPALDRASVEDVKSFHRQYYGPAQLRLVFAGDIDDKAIRSQVAKSFSGWKGGVEAVRAAPPLTASSGTPQSIDMPQKASVSVVMGVATGLRYADSDALALRVGTAILGSGFTGRLMHTVRVQEGLTYGIDAGIGSDEFVDGALIINATFAPKLLDKGVASTRREVQRWRQGGVSADELAARKTNLIGRYQIGMSTTAGMAKTILMTVERNEPLSWLDDYPGAVIAVTLDQVNAAISQYVDPQKMVLIEAGTPGTKQ